MNDVLLEWIGYLASFIVLISLLMSSIIKLRWINLLGSSIFAIYGFLIGALPVAFMNIGIAIINIYYLVKIYGSKEYFKLIPLLTASLYFNYFLEFYQEGIQKYMNTSGFNFESAEISFYILRNTVPAGIFLGSRYDENTLKVELDFVTPEYRDFKIGTYIYETKKDYFLKHGFSKLVCFSSNEKHIQYLRKMGFKEYTGSDTHFFIKELA
ncbi:GNAT family N-acetyltransferase [Cellulosilyticum sp. I15G10I2]|uniref:GNAT family N-acetyltransferase n=1 Tax=Cellulosilyticum sp. I15G10I2 TaxID=1892843 RepID=UPI00085CDF37|nr:GNAT family N-acetyltransferase [Cellulosilyticum sp. I15G10I2]